MKWKTEALTKGCVAAAKHLGKFAWLKEFYLAGGTALALWYGHRVSVDLDFFSNSNVLDSSDRQTIMKDLGSLRGEVEEEKEGTVHGRLGSTHVSFFRYTYPLLKPSHPWGSIRVAHPLDIGLMKIGAIIGRGSKKDFYDLAAILSRECTLTQLLRLSKKKFKGHRDFWLQASRALVYFNDADREPNLKLLDSADWPTIKLFFEKETRKIIIEHLN